MEFELNYQEAIRGLKTYASNANNPGSCEVKAFTKVIAWMCYNAQEELMSKATARISELMHSFCNILKGMDSKESAQTGMDLIAALQGAFRLGLAVGNDCPVAEIFETQAGRLAR